MKLSSRDATIVDAALFAQYDGSADVALNDPVGQITHSKALLELVSHSKAAPDSLAVFLNDLLALGYNGGNRDFRRDTFKKKLASSRASLEPESSDGNHNYCCDESDALFHAGTD